MFEIVFACVVIPGLGGFIAAIFGAPLLILGIIAGALGVLGLIGFGLVLNDGKSSGSGGMGVLVFSALFILAGISLELGAVLGHYVQ